MKMGFLLSLMRVRYDVDFILKSRSVFILLLLFFQNLFFAQEFKSEENPSSQTVIFIHGATIHSQDESFNKQIFKKAELKNVEVDQTSDGQLNVVAVNNKKQIKELPSDKVLHKEKEILAKKHKEIVTPLPKKEIVIHINKAYDGDKFLLGNCSKAHSFIFPNNDFSASDDFVLLESKTISQPLDYLHSDSFIYKNDLSIFKGCTSGFSVRPPPYLS